MGGGGLPWMAWWPPYKHDQKKEKTIKHERNWNRQSCFTSGVLLTSVPDVFFSCRGAKLGWAGVPASASLQGPGGPVQADRTSIFLGGKINVCQCHIFRSCSIVEVHRSEHFLVMFQPKFGHIYLVMWTSLRSLCQKYPNKCYSFELDTLVLWSNASCTKSGDPEFKSRRLVCL